jgi:thiamine-monophosphate kinase
MFPRSPCQINCLHGSDAELISLDCDSKAPIAITVDSIAEEIAAGLYADPYLAGWMGVMASMSDLAAVGAEPFGIIISEILPRGMPQDSIEALQSGIRDACAVCGTYVLGGDTNTGNELSITGCAIGRTGKRRNLTRIGISPGDLLYTTGTLGAGNGFALNLYMGASEKGFLFRPEARLKEGQMLGDLAAACMDSSDGVLATLDQLMRLNNTGFQIDSGWQDLLHRDSRRLASLSGIPEWFLLAGQHGEFELLFTVRREDETRLHDRASREGWEPLRLGRATSTRSITINISGKEVIIPTGEIRDIALGSGSDLEANVAGLQGIHDRIMTDSLLFDDTRMR